MQAFLIYCFWKLCKNFLRKISFSLFLCSVCTITRIISTVKWWVLIFLLFFCKPFKINGLQYLISFEIVIFSVLTPIWHQFLFLWCQAFNTILSSLAISFSILVSSPIWLYTSIVTSIWACPIIYWRTFTSIRHSAILVQAVWRITWAENFGNNSAFLTRILQRTEATANRYRNDRPVICHWHESCYLWIS